MPIPDDLIKKILLDDEPGSAMEKGKRNYLTKTVAEQCRKQGSYEMASNLYLKLG